jgi:dTDP-4-dehydrorhamnose 3,5-epimerase
MLKGIKIKSVCRFPDERGFFCEVMRKDWRDFFSEDTIAQANFSHTYPNIVRAWHRHLKGQIDYFLAIKGAIKIGAFDDQTGEINEIVSSALNLQLVRIPGHYWHGFKSLGDEPAMLVYFTTNLYDYSKPDEDRRPWNDPTIVPKSVNGKKDDARVGKPWDWNYLPNK